ncbi:DUF4189 domain-containing protein [Amorphus coralli]|uniref:DUF4189 domain-containing protein n=1 Tax=Amorphus coralli TaxID=340680 RepID=UPI00035EC45E|nr:DUF4189 domain-containing protein [Amorphus coralli]
MKTRLVPYFAAVALAVATTGLPTAAMADDDTFIAAAYSKHNGSVGFAAATSEADAKSKAISECEKGASDCQVMISGSQMCISLARSADEKSLGLGGSNTRAGSQDEAMKECAVDGAKGCNIHDTYCAPSSLK